MKYYVDCMNGHEEGDGSSENPFKRIQQAADIAAGGDEVIVMPGIYRENVDPKNSGEENNPVVYRSEQHFEAIITGAEFLLFWEQTDGNVYRAEVSNDIFTEGNPYAELVSGDWYRGKGQHRGDIFLNGKSMYEVSSIDEVKHPEVSLRSWDREFSVFVWYAEVNEDKTVFYANFQGRNPNSETVEISVRRNCFFPKKTGVNYITVSGFIMGMTASDWAPPTAYQEGVIGPHWSKGWIIEDCDIFESKCAGISLGKYYQPENNNKWSRYGMKDGTQTQRECVCRAVNEGWSKEKVGSHIIRGCGIHDCGQAGIVGHLGGAFSLIENNHIYRINNKQNLIGEEIGGIKLHAAIDVVIRNNRIHFCTKGLWLDWQAQGTRVTGNLFYDNTLPVIPENTDVSTIDGSEIGEDLFIEVSHGPTTVDNNIFLSYRSIRLCAQGVAFVNNIIAGGFTAVGLGVNNNGVNYPSPRYTPYHVPHSTDIAGFMTFPQGDDRLYNNIFIRRSAPDVLIRLMNHMEQVVRTVPGQDWDNGNVYAGTDCFDIFPNESEWKKTFEGVHSNSDRYYAPMPVWTGGNAFFNNAGKYRHEENYTEIDEKALFNIIKDGDDIYLETDIYDFLEKAQGVDVSTAMLGQAFEPEQAFENPDGSEIDFKVDYLGKKWDKNYIGCFGYVNDYIKIKL